MSVFGSLKRAQSPVNRISVTPPSQQHNIVNGGGSSVPAAFFERAPSLTSATEVRVYSCRDPYFTWQYDSCKMSSSLKHLRHDGPYFVARVKGLGSRLLFHAVQRRQMCLALIGDTEIFADLCTRQHRVKVAADHLRSSIASDAPVVGPRGGVAV